MSTMMGPAILITLGVLFLLQQTNWGWSWGFHRTWPVLLIVIGIIKVLQYTAPIEGHVPVGYIAPAPFVNPPPAPPAAPSTNEYADPNREDGHV
jgi:hypothetical protein